MSSSTDDGGDKPTKKSPTDTTTTTTTATSLMADLSKQVETSQQALDSARKQARGSLKSAIHSAVVGTNRFLSSAQDTATNVANQVSVPVAKGIEQGSALTDKLVTYYDRRYEYGPLIVVGTGVLVGGIFSLRRGRLPGAFMGLVGGGLAYEAVYQPLPLNDIVDTALGRRDA